MKFTRPFVLFSFAIIFNILYPFIDLNFSNNNNIKIIDSSTTENIIPLGFSDDSKYLLCIKSDITRCYLDDIAKAQFIIYQLHDIDNNAQKIYNIESIKDININGLFLIPVKNKNSIDIYSIQLVKGEIVKCEFLPFNTNANEIFGSFTYKKTKIYFASDRAGGFGGYDIYEVEYLGDGKWSNPRNLGSAVNTSADEVAPFILNDDLTLFFSRNTSVGKNNFDIFYSTILDDGSLDIAENLGDSINTEIDDLFVRINEQTNKAVFISKNINTCTLYEINL
jgi:hypothetical protein